MEAKDLRIGNLVYLPSKAIYSVDILYKNYDMLKVWQPIPLTEDWLIKLCVKKMPRGLIWLSLTKLNAEIHFETYSQQNGDVEVVSTLINSVCELILERIYYVHQLQNLYFALTGEELTVRL